MRVVGAKETWYDHFGKVRHFLKKLNTYLPPDPTAQGKLKCISKQRFGEKKFVAMLFTIATK